MFVYTPGTYSDLRAPVDDFVEGNVNFGRKEKNDDYFERSLSRDATLLNIRADHLESLNEIS